MSRELNKDLPEKRSSKRKLSLLESMVAVPTSPRRAEGSQSERQAVVGYYQRYTGVVGSNTLDSYLRRALTIKNGDMDSAVDYASLLVKRIEGIRSPLSPRGLEDSPCARTSPFLQRQPDSILAAVSEFLEPEDFCALRASSATICSTQNLFSRHYHSVDDNSNFVLL